ncbi:MAG: YfjI family protein [Syntrophotaleaceae bacterium]
MSPLPDWLKSKPENRKASLQDLYAGVPEGQRNNALVRLVGSFIGQGANLKAAYDMASLGIVAILHRFPTTKCFRQRQASTKNMSAPKDKKGAENIRLIRFLGPILSHQAPHFCQSNHLIHHYSPEHSGHSWLISRNDCRFPWSTRLVLCLLLVAQLLGPGWGAPKAKDSWVVIPNLWGALVGPPGQLKTPALEQAIKPLKFQERLAREAYRECLADYEADLELHKIRKKQLQANIRKNFDNTKTSDYRQQFAEQVEPAKPRPKRYLTNDATGEKLVDILTTNERGLLVCRDELIGQMLSWDKPGRETERALFLEGWNGNGSFYSDRITRGTQHADHVCISLLGTIQPDRLCRYLFEAMEGNNDGLIQRFQLAVFPDQKTTWVNVDRPPNKNARNRIFEVFKLLAVTNFRETDLPVEEIDGSPAIRFDPEAQNVFNLWLEELEAVKLKNSDDPDAVIEHLAKYRSLVPSLALIHHLTEYAEGDASGRVTAIALKAAIGHAEVLESHARRIYGLLRSSKNHPAIRLAEAIKRGNLSLPSVTAMYIRRTFIGLTRPSWLSGPSRNWLISTG